jgi:hypothetical protein
MLLFVFVPSIIAGAVIGFNSGIIAALAVTGLGVLIEVFA